MRDFTSAGLELDRGQGIQRKPSHRRQLPGQRRFTAPRIPKDGNLSHTTASAITSAHWFFVSAFWAARPALRSARCARSFRRAPFLVYRAHLRSQHVLPSRVHDAIDQELECGLGGGSHVCGVSKDVGAGCRIVDEQGSPCDEELVASRLRLGKALKSVPAVL